MPAIRLAQGPRDLREGVDTPGGGLERTTADFEEAQRASLVVVPRIRPCR